MIRTEAPSPASGVSQTVSTMPVDIRPSRLPAKEETVHRILTVCALLVAFSIPSSTRAQPLPSWQEHSGARHTYSLSGVRILVVVAEQFNDQEAAQMAACWRGWGAKV